MAADNLMDRARASHVNVAGSIPISANTFFWRLVAYITFAVEKQC